MDGEKCKASWMHISNNDTTVTNYAVHEWTMSRAGFIENYDQFDAWYIRSKGYVNSWQVNVGILSARPVFYLTPDIILKEGTTGEKDNPYIINGIPVSLGEFCAGQTNMGTCITNKKSVIGEVDNITSTEVGGMYRYQGTDNVNNYICFGTTDKSACTSPEGIDKYMYRIIGITSDGQLALIKETGVKEGNETRFQWNDKSSTIDCGSNGEKCNWANSKLFNRLNGLCTSSNANCTGTGNGKDGQTNIFINSEYYDYLTIGSTWESKISTHTWKHGNYKRSDKSLDVYDGNIIYGVESKFMDNIQAKVGLQYIHDYLLAYPGGNPSTAENAGKSWIYSITYAVEWVITKIGNVGSYIDAWNVSYRGMVYGTYSGLENMVYARPVFYLTPDIKLSNTAGSKEDPYILDV